MPFLSEPPSFSFTSSIQPFYNMETYTENTYYLVLVIVVVTANVTRLKAPKIKNMVVKRLEVLPISCEYSGLVYSP
jgi:hypothetical protein